MKMREKYGKSVNFGKVSKNAIFGGILSCFMCWKSLEMFDYNTQGMLY